MLKIKNLTKKYNNKVILNNISYEFKENSLYYIVGKSGCGKSTLIYILSGLDTLYSGQVLYNSKDIAKLSSKEKEDFLFYDVSFAFQDYKVNAKKKVYDLIISSLNISSLTKEEKKERIKSYLSRLGLLSKINSTFSTLSGGEKKRVALVCALVKESNIVFVDEPTSALNKGLRNIVNELLLEESKKRTIIVITHDIDGIEEKSILLRLQEGKLIEENNNIKENKNKTKDKLYKRVNYSSSIFIKNLFQELKLKREYLYLSLTSFVIGLFTLTLSLILSDSVTTSLNNSFSKYMNSNTLVVKKKENEVISNSYKIPSDSKIYDMKKELSNYILSIKDFYVTNIDQIINANQQITINLDKKNMVLENITLESFIESKNILEISEDELLITNKEELNDDEIILGLSESNIKSLYYLLKGKKINSIEEANLKELLYDNVVSLRLQTSKIEWNYFLDYSFRVVGIVKSHSNYIMTSSFSFGNNFVHNVLNFKDRYVGEDKYNDYPALLEKERGIVIKPGLNADFISSFLKSRFSDMYALKLNENKKHFIENNFDTYNRYFIYEDYLSKFSYMQINRFVNDHLDKISYISYSTPAYTFTSSGYISGFTKPFFFSKYKNKLIEIEGTYNYAEENIGQLQASSIKTDASVFKADLLSSIDSSGVKFVPINQNNSSLLYGDSPSNNLEIAISSSFAYSLSNDISSLIGTSLHTLVLDRTIKSSDGYINKFTFGELNISGIYLNDDIAIYQDSLFPFSYLFAHSILDPSEIAITDAVIQVDLDNYSSEYYINELRKYGDYKGTFPMLQIIIELNKTMDRIKLVFTILSSITIIAAFFLIILSIYLIIEKDRKEIGILLTLGYRKKDIVNYYVSLSLLIGIISYLLSLIASLLSQKVIQEQLSIMLNESSFSLKPYLISFLVAIVSTFLIGLTSIIPIYKLDIKQTLSKY